MTNMFKRSLVALAIAGASTGAMAADVTLTDTTYATDEFMSTMDEVLSKNVIITLNDEYKEGDYIYLRFEDGAYIDGHPNQLTVGYAEQLDEGDFDNDGNTYPATPGGYNDDADNDDVNKGITVDFVAQTSDNDGHTVLVYRVTNVYGDQMTASNDTTYDIELDFGRFNFDAPVVVAQSGVMFDTFSRIDTQPWPTTTNPWPFDTVPAGDEETQLFKMGPQFELVVDKEFSGELDVWEYRREFRTAGGSHGNNYLTDDGEFHVATTLNPDGGAWDFEVQIDGGATEQIEYTLSGDNMFGWIDSANPQGLEAIFTGNSCTYISHTANALDFRCATVDVVTNLMFDLMGTTSSYNNPKQDGEFALSATVNWTHTGAAYTAPEDGVLTVDPAFGETDLSALFAGEWTVNGSVTHIPYMPYSAQSASGEVTPISQIIYVTNKLRDPGFDDVIGSTDPAPGNPNVDRIIWVDAMAEDGTMYGPYTLNALANSGVTAIAGEIREALFVDGALATSGKFSLTVNVADYPTNISIYSAYNVNGSDRGWVQNDSVRTDLDLYKGNDIVD
ncbi:hypothetical protein ACQ5ES_05575 [Pseudidiomarina sp. E22-M8]|uniref:hypothetical protein n=1 Tax=Pseudidiomarina sp. E22-M8 TaxID=3424768 RepID=UPI00403C6EDD